RLDRARACQAGLVRRTDRASGGRRQARRRPARDLCGRDRAHAVHQARDEADAALPSQASWAAASRSGRRRYPSLTPLDRLAALHHVELVDDGRVAARAAVDDVALAVARQQRVVAGAAVELVAARAADDQVVAAEAPQ